jgi:adenylate kinase
MALVGGGQGSFIGRVHCTAAVLDNRAALVAGALSSNPEKSKASAADYDIPHIASGEILRAEMQAGTELGLRVKDVYDRGDLVSDDLMIELIRTRLAQPDTDAGFVLDGFPRTLAQAEALDQMLREIGKELSVVFVLQLPQSVAIDRLTKRAELEGRVDDTPEGIARRLELYRRETEPLIEWYRVRSNVVAVHADRSPNAVFGEIQEALEQAAVV